MNIETKEITQVQRTEDKNLEVKSGARKQAEVREVRTPTVNRDPGDESEAK